MALSSPTRLAGQVELDYDDPYLRIQFPAAQAHTPPTPRARRSSRRPNQTQVAWRLRLIRGDSDSASRIRLARYAQLREPEPPTRTRRRLWCG